MRTLQLYIAASLDGYIASPDGGVDWLFTDQDYGYGSFYARIDTLLMGYLSYEKILSFGEYPYAGKQSYVFSRRGDRQVLPPAERVQEDPAAFVRRLKASEGGPIWLLGGGQIVHLLRTAGLIDELILAVHPLILGGGIPLFPPGEARSELQHLETLTYDSGLVQLHYQFRNP